MCPQDIPDATVWTKRNIFITSYVWNGAIIAYNENGNPPGRALKLSKFKGSNILQWENNEKGPGGGNWNDFSSYPLEAPGNGGAGSTVADITFSQRHGKDAQIGRLDGGAARITYTEMVGMALNTSSKNDLWCNPNSPNGH